MENIPMIKVAEYGKHTNHLWIPHPNNITGKPLVLLCKVCGLVWTTDIVKEDNKIQIVF